MRSKTRQIKKKKKRRSKLQTISRRKVSLSGRFFFPLEASVFNFHYASKNNSAAWWHNALASRREEEMGGGGELSKASSQTPPPRDWCQEKVIIKSQCGNGTGQPAEMLSDWRPERTTSKLSFTFFPKEKKAYMYIFYIMGVILIRAFSCSMGVEKEGLTPNQSDQAAFWTVSLWY